MWASPGLAEGLHRQVVTGDGAGIRGQTLNDFKWWTEAFVHRSRDFHVIIHVKLRSTKQGGGSWLSRLSSGCCQ